MPGAGASVWCHCHPLQLTCDSDPGVAMGALQPLSLLQHLQSAPTDRCHCRGTNLQFPTLQATDYPGLFENVSVK